MKTLCSKIQFKNFEVGEFGEIRNRTLDETLKLTYDFPWETERALASVKLHCPSVTIKHPSGSFLKIGPYFSGKFCVYHCGKRGEVTYLVLNELNEITSPVTDFFKGELNLSGFQKYKYVINPLQYFKTNPYEYKPGSKAIFNYLKLDLVTVVAPAFIIFTQFFTNWSMLANPYATCAILGFITLFCGPGMYLLFDYEPYYQHQYLKISRGHRYFIFGDVDGNKEYDKAEIFEICRYYNHRGRNPWSGSQVYKLVFKDGKILIFSSLLITEWAFVKKFPGAEIKSEHIFFPTMDNTLIKIQRIN